MTGFSPLQEVRAQLSEAREGIGAATRAVGTARTELAAAIEAMTAALPQHETGRLGNRFALASATLENVEQRLAAADTAVDSFAGRL